MIKKIFKSKNIIIYIIIVIILIEIIILLSKTTTDQPTKTTPQTSLTSPTIIPTVTQEVTSLNPPTTYPTISNPPQPQPNDSTIENIEILDLDYRRPLSRFLPYQGKYFKSQRYVGTNKLEILIKDKADIELAKQEAQAWLVENGVDQDDEIIVSYRY